MHYIYLPIEIIQFFPNLSRYILSPNKYKLYISNETYRNSFPDCTYWPDHTDNTEKVILTLSIIILIIGIVGNTLGLYGAIKQIKTNIFPIVNRIFYVVCLLNMVFLLIYPTIDTLGQIFGAPISRNRAWQRYMADWHFPLAKTFISFAFTIYMLFSICQSLGIVYPVYFKNKITALRIKLAVVIGFAYNLVWFLPSAYWFHVVALINNCNAPSSNVLYKKIFDLYFYTPSKAIIAYSGLLLIMSRVLPAIVIIGVGIFTLLKKRDRLRKKFQLRDPPSTNLAAINTISNNQLYCFLNYRKLIACWNQWSSCHNLNKCLNPLGTLGTTTHFQENIITRENHIKDLKSNSILPIVPSNLTNQSNHDCDTSLPMIENNSNRICYRNIFSRIFMTKSPRVKPLARNSTCDLTNDPTISLPNSCDQYRLKQRLEYQVSVRMLVILLIEMVLFLLPISIYLFVANKTYKDINGEKSLMAFASCILLEYLFVSLSFYLNFMFNPGFRQEYYEIISKTAFYRALRKIYLRGTQPSEYPQNISII